MPKTKKIFLSVLILAVAANLIVIPAKAGISYIGFQNKLEMTVAKAASPIQESFDVKKYLRIGGKEKDEETGTLQGKEQGKAYFEREGVSPAAAFIVDVIDFLIAFIGVFSLLVFILGAVLTIVSEGQEDRLQKGKQAMVYSLIGLVLALFSYLIATFVQSLFY